MSKLTTLISRGKILESSHEIKCFIGSINGKTIFSTNNEKDIIYPRSSIKIFQGIPFSSSNAVKLIKMDPGTSVPLHSHNGKEYILVLDGSFCDEYGEYNKGDMQINDQKIKHNPTACKSNGCVCLSITENDVVFFGKFGSALNLFTFIKSFFK